MPQSPAFIVAVPSLSSHRFLSFVNDWFLLLTFSFVNKQPFIYLRLLSFLLFLSLRF